MSATRREFVQITLASGAAFALGIRFGRSEEGQQPWQPNAWLRIGTDGKVTIVVGKSEMGQGVRTSLPMIVAEELDADWSDVVLEQASPGPMYKSLGTGGSFSLGGSWNALRKAGATAREMLILAAAAKWNIDKSDLVTSRGVVMHSATGRRLSYGEVASSAAKIPVPQTVTLKKQSDFRIIGRRMPRVDGPHIVTGAAQYGLDVRIPGMLFAVVVRPPAVGDKVKAFDATRTRHVHGVKHVVQVPTGIAVVADSTWSAIKGARSLGVKFNTGPNRDFDSRQYLAKLEEASRQPGVITRNEGDAPSAMSGTHRTLDATYIYPFFAHAAVEPVNTTAWVRGKSCEIWAPTQTPNGVQTAVARTLGIPPESVKVHVTLIGGGFGRRLRPDYAIEAAEVSKSVQAPVQVVWTREDDFRFDLLQHASVHALNAGMDSDGNLIAWSHRKASNRHMTQFDPPNADEARDLAIYYREGSWGAYDNPYAIPNLQSSYVQVDSPVRYGPWRAVFSPSSTFARECFVDEIAHALKRDPLDFRMELLRGADIFKAGELTIDRRRLRGVLKVVQQKSSWGSKMPEGRGRGVACNVYDGDTHVAYVAEVTATKDGLQIDRIVCAIDCGLVVNPTGVEQQVEGGILWALGQLASEITIAGGAVEQRNFSDYPVPRLSDSPRAIEIHSVDSGASQPFGMGEPPVPPLVPAVLNAYFNASGRRVRRLGRGALS